MHIAIIGAGFSGLYAATLLEQAGHRVTVYEKTQRVGGHCASLQNNESHVEMGTVVSFSKKIKKLMIELQVEYQERFVYRNFVDEHFETVEQLCPSAIVKLQAELQQLKSLLTTYGLYPSPLFYGPIPQDLTIPCAEFLNLHQFTLLDQLIEPYLSSFGFGSIHSVPAYYVFHAFDLHIVEALLQGERFLFASFGMQSLTDALAKQLQDIRCDREIIAIEEGQEHVEITTTLDRACFDRVFVSCPLPPAIFKNRTQQVWMQQVATNPYVTYVFEVENKDLVTTYFKHHFGKQNKIQFFTVRNQSQRTLLVAHAYGTRTNVMVNELIDDLANSHIQIKHLITSRQWAIFPHIPQEKLESTTYQSILAQQKQRKIQWIGSLITNPSIDKLYESIHSHITSWQP